MSQITQLILFIKKEGSVFYDEVVAEARRINPMWRESTFTRGLRASNEVKAVYLDDKPNSPIVAYNYIGF